MPIRPENRARYPHNWKTEIVPAIRARSGNRCECMGQCGRIHNRRQEVEDGGTPRCRRRNGEVGGIDSSGDWQEYPHLDDVEKRVTIVLTVAHLDHTPENCDPANLLHLCQGCHNRYDAPTRAAGIKARRKATMAAGDLFCEEAK